MSDNVAMMVSAAQEFLAASPLPDVECRELDSHDLQLVPNNYFTHSIDNFSIFTLLAPPTPSARHTAPFAQTASLS